MSRLDVSETLVADCPRHTVLRFDEQLSFEVNCASEKSRQATYARLSSRAREPLTFWAGVR